MSTLEHGPEHAISLLSVVNHLVERRFLVVGVAALTAVLAVAPAQFAPASYTSTALAVAAQPAAGLDPRLQGVAGQLGVNIGGGSGSSALAGPGALAELAASPALLLRLLDDRVADPALGAERLVDLLAGPLTDSGPQSEASRREQAVGVLRQWINVESGDLGGSIILEVSSPSPLVSLHVATRLLDEFARFNQEINRGGAYEERRFIEGRLADQERALREAEGRLIAFLNANRNVGSSAELNFERDRLQRQVSLQQQVLVSLAQSREEVRLREVRDRPVLTVVEPPTLPLMRNPKGRGRRLALGLVAGLALGSLLAFAVGLWDGLVSSDAPDAVRFRELLATAVPFRGGRSRGDRTARDH